MARCDICGEMGDRDAMTTYGTAQMSALTKSGFMPKRLPPEMHRRARDPDEERLVLQWPDGSATEFDMRDPQNALKALWIMSAALADSDWAVCAACEADIRAHRDGSAAVPAQRSGGMGWLAAVLLIAIGVAAAAFYLFSSEPELLDVAPAATEQAVD